MPETQAARLYGLGGFDISGGGQGQLGIYSEIEVQVTGDRHSGIAPLARAGLHICFYLGS